MKNVFVTESRRHPFAAQDNVVKPNIDFEKWVHTVVKPTIAFEKWARSAAKPNIKFEKMKAHCKT